MSRPPRRIRPPSKRVSPDRRPASAKAKEEVEIRRLADQATRSAEFRPTGPRRNRREPRAETLPGLIWVKKSCVRLATLGRSRRHGGYGGAEEESHPSSVGLL